MKENRRKEENNLTKFAILILFITMVALILVSGTYAKYTTSVTGIATATVAKWSIEVNNTEIAVANPTVTFDLFKTINDSGNTADETDVVDTKIAPGTEGSFDLVIENLSEVTATYQVEFELTNTGKVPLEFSVNGGDWAGTLSAATAKADLAAKTGTETVTVDWRWAFESGADDAAKEARNKADTALGITPVDVKVSATIIATQVD